MADVPSRRPHDRFWHGADLSRLLTSSGALGYVEGKNFTTEYRFKPESLSQAAADLVRLNVTAIFAATPPALAAASNATTSIRGAFGERPGRQGICQESFPAGRQRHGNVS